MSNIITYEPKPSARVVVESVIITGSSNPENIGIRTYLLTYIDEDGGSCIVSDRSTYTEIQADARDWSADGVRVIDHVRNRA
ncbi:hypothetical protein M1D80_11080 [Phyllobacteriaceae bacterium JZ32]